MKKLIISLFVLAMCGQAWCANYCVKPTGTVTIANKATAIVANAATCTAAANAAALNMAQVNAATAGNAFAAGSTIYFSAKDGSGVDTTYTTALAIPSSGSSGSPIIFAGIVDGTGGTLPLISLAASAITNAGMSYITLQDLRAIREGSAGTDRAIT